MKDKNNISGLIAKVQQAPTKTIQKVSPIQPPKNGTQFSFWIDKGLLKKLKIKAVDEGRSLKDLVTQSIQKYLETDQDS